MKNKIGFLGTILLLSIMSAYPVMAADVQGCSVLGDGVKIDTKFTTMTHLAIVIIQIIVPIVLVIFGMIDLMKGITAQKEDEIKKGQQIFIKRLIAAAIVFFVIAIVKLLFSFVSNDTDGNMLDCVNCFLNGTDKTGNCNKN